VGDGEDEDAEGSGQPLEVDRRGDRGGLDLPVGEPAPDGAGQAMPGPGLAVDAFIPKTMLRIKAAPALAPA